jgi:hypothetical protein
MTGKKWRGPAVCALQNAEPKQGYAENGEILRRPAYRCSKKIWLSFSSMEARYKKI